MVTQNKGQGKIKGFISSRKLIVQFVNVDSIPNEEIVK